MGTLSARIYELGFPVGYLHHFLPFCGKDLTLDAFKCQEYSSWRINLHWASRAWVALGFGRFPRLNIVYNAEQRGEIVVHEETKS